jgi:hypothetical protein
MSGKIAISQQIGAVRLEIEQRKIKPGKMNRSQVEYHLSRLEAAAITLEWLRANEAHIRGVLAQPIGDSTAP